MEVAGYAKPGSDMPLATPIFLLVRAHNFQEDQGMAKSNRGRAPRDKKPSLKLPEWPRATIKTQRLQLPMDTKPLPNVKKVTKRLSGNRTVKYREDNPSDLDAD